MHHHYRDIRDRLGEPQWWDEVGVPRYCPFSPNETNNIYCDQVVLLEIACQNCGRLFQVAMSWSVFDKVLRNAPTLSKRVEEGWIHYGDPPNAGCCPSGPTMNSEARRVLEFWRKNDKFEFERVPELEIEIPQGELV